MSKRSSNEGQAHWPRDPEKGRGEHGIPDADMAVAVHGYVVSLLAAAPADAVAKDRVERQKALLLRELRWAQNALTANLLSTYAPLLQGRARRLANDAAEYADHYGHLRESFLKVVDRYDGTRPFRVYLNAHIGHEAKQSLSRHVSHDGLGSEDRQRRIRPKVRKTVRELEQEWGRVPTDDEVVDELARRGRHIRGGLITLADVIRVRHGGHVQLDPGMHGHAEEHGFERLEMVERVQAAFERASARAKAGRLDVFLITVSHVAGIQDKEISSWARGCDGGTFIQSLQTTSDALGCVSWPEVQARVGVPPHLRATPSEALKLIEEKGTSKKVSSLQKNRKRKEVALRRHSAPSGGDRAPTSRHH